MNLRKLFASFSVLAIVASVVSPVVVNAAANVPAEYLAAYNFAKDNGLTSMPTFEKFNFYWQVTRQAFAKFSTKTLEKMWKAEIKFSEDACSFEDLNQADPTLRADIVKACQYGLMWINSNTNEPMDKFNPRQVMNRAQVITVISRMLNGDEYNGWTPFRLKHEENLYNKGIITKRHPEVNAYWPAVRWYSVLMLMRAVDYVAKNADQEYTEDELKELCADETMASMLGDLCDNVNTDEWTWTTNEETGEQTEVKAGTLEISKGNGTVLNDNDAIPMVGTVRFMEVNFKAWNEDVTVNSVDLQKVGLWNNSDIKRVYFEDVNGKRVSSRASLRNDGTATVSISPALEVKANSTESLYLVVELSWSTAWAYHAFKITNVESSAEKVLWLWLTSPTLVTANYTVAGIKLTSISDGGTYSDWNYQKIKLWQWKIENTYDTEDKTVIVKSLVFKNEWDADIEQSLSNVVVERDGKVVSDKVYMDGKYLTITFKDEKIEPNKIGVYTLYGDVNYVDNTSWDTYDFTINKEDRVNIVEESTLFKVTFVDWVNLNLWTYTVEGWDVTLRTALDFDKTQTVMMGAQDLPIMEWTIVATTEVTLEDHKWVALEVKSDTWVCVSLDTAKKIITNIDLVIGGETVNGTLDTSWSCLKVTFDGTFTVKWTEDVKVLVDLATDSDNSYTNYTIKLGDLSLDQFDVTYVNTDNDVTSASYVGRLTSATFTIDKSRLSATRIDGYGDNKKVLEWTTDYVVLKAELTNDSSVDVDLTSLTFKLSWDYNGKLATYMYINDEFKAQDSAKTWETLDYNGFTYTLKAWEKATVTIVADLESTKVWKFQLVLTNFLGTDVNGTVYDIVNSPDMNVSSVVFDVTTQAANVTVSDDTNSKSRLLSAYDSSTNSNLVELGRVQVEAYDDDVTLDTLYVMAANTGLVATSWDVMKNLDKYVSSLSLYREDWTFVANWVYKNNANIATWNSDKTTWDYSAFEFTNINNNNEIKNGDTVTFVLKWILNEINETWADIQDIRLFVPKYITIDTNNTGVNYTWMVVEQSNGTALTGYLEDLNETILSWNGMYVSKKNTIVNSTVVVADVTDTTNTLDVMQFTVTVTWSKVKLANFTFGGTDTGIVIYKDSISSTNVVYSWSSNGDVVLMDNYGTTSATTWVELSEWTTKFYVRLQTALANNATYTVELQDVKYYDNVKGDYTTGTVSLQWYENVGTLPITKTYTNN